MDTAILDWLSQISDPQHVEVRFDESELILRCKDTYIAYERWKNRRQLIDAGFNLSVWVGEELLGSTLQEKIMQTIHSTWACKNSELLKSMGEFCTVAIHSEAPGYNYLAIHPFLGIQEVMCKPIAELLGQPATTATTVIGETRAAAITKAIRDGGTATEDYDFTWNGAVWKKRVTAIYLPGESEILVQTTDRDAWQSGYWRNYVRVA